MSKYNKHNQADQQQALIDEYNNFMCAHDLEQQKTRNRRERKLMDKKRRRG